MSQSLTLSAGTLMLAVPSLMTLGGGVVFVALRGFLTTGIEVARLNADNDERTARWLWLRGYRTSPHAGPDVTDDMPAIEAATAEVCRTNDLTPHGPVVAHDRNGEPRCRMCAEVMGLHVDGEVLHVEHPTGEIHRPTLADLAEEVALVQALSDRPAEDEDEVGEEQPGEAQSRLLAKLHAFLRWLDRMWAQRPDFLKSADQRAAEFWAEPEDADPFERFRIDDNPRGRSAASEPVECGSDDGIEFDEDFDQAVMRSQYTGRHWAAGTEHTGLHPIVVIPEQRTGGDRDE